MELNKKNLMLKEDGNENITKEIKNDLTNIQCRNIEGNMRWIRNCPKCNKEILYDNKYYCVGSSKKNRFCIQCSNFKRRKYENLSFEIDEIGNKKWIKFCSNIDCNKKIYYSNESNLRRSIRNNATCNSCARKKNPTINNKETRDKIRKTLKKNYIKEKHPMFGKPRPEETRKKLRIARIKEIEDKHGTIFPNYHKPSIFILNEINELLNWNLVHAENGGEFCIESLGYWVDGYDKERNIVVEFYEDKHKRSIDRDVKRQKEIEEFLNCKFYVIWYNQNWKEILREYII